MNTKHNAIPLGLKMIGAYVFQGSYDGESIATMLAKADRVAQRVVAEPLGTTPHHDSIDVVIEGLINEADNDRADALKMIAFYFESGKERCTSPTDAANEVVSGLAHVNATAGFALGLCLAFRLCANTYRI